MKVLILAGLLPALLLGCARQDERVKIRIWHEKVSAERAFFEEAVARYNAAHPEVEVEVLYRELEDLRNLYVVAAVGGQGPDLIYSAADNASIYDITETILPLDSVFAPAFFEPFTDEGIVSWKGKRLMVADQVRTYLAFVHNRALMPRAPETTDEWVAVLQDLTKDTDGDGRPDQYGLTWNYREPFFFIPFLTGYGGWVMDAEGNPTLDTEATIRAIRFVLDLRDKYNVIPKESDYEVAQALFLEGRTASIINGPWAFAGYGQAGIDYSVAMLPKNAETGLWSAPMTATSGYAINSNVTPEKLPYVRDLIAYLTSAEIQAQMVQRLETIPVHREVARSSLVQDNPRLQAALKQVEVGRPMPIAPQMRQIWDGMRGPYQLVMNGAVTPEVGARMMQAAVERRIDDALLEAEGDPLLTWLPVAAVALILSLYFLLRRRAVAA